MFTLEGLAFIVYSFEFWFLPATIPEAWQTAASNRSLPPFGLCMVEARGHGVLRGQGIRPVGRPSK